MDDHFYEPRLGHGLPHDPFKAIVAPRPIGWIGTRSRAGVRNLAPYSFFNALSYTPPLVGFSSIGDKDSVRNARETGVFTWNLVTRAQAEAMNATSATVGPEVDEFELAGLHGVPSTDVAPERVAGAPVAFECRLTQLVRLTDQHGAELDAWAMTAPAGYCFVLGYGGEFKAPTLDFVAGEKNVIGNIVGTYNDLAELMVLAQAGKVTLHTVQYPLESALEALHDLDAGKVRGRAILVP